MKKYIVLTILISISLLSKAQAPNFDDLKILYADGNYEKLVAQAEKYTLKEDLKKDPVPFMWLAKGLDKVASSGTDNEKFKNAYKDAIAALSKAIKNDKDSSCYNANREFVDGFQMGIVERVTNELDANDFKKAAGWDTKYYKISFHIIGAKYLEGACKYLATDKGGANALWVICDKELAKITSVENWSKADLELLKIGILKTAECQIASRQTEKARKLLDKVAPWFEEDPDFKAKYDELVN
ncbi:MAG: hypothetical protein HYR91_00780 [Flavobacteriia bacterium]|nr:hypothetical protein [Flavobacteriia bacterium]